jgi:AcrR family transcriptional regulator
MPDRRPQRTRQLLRDALIALILERGYDDITVQHITDKANLGRATFYLHFKDKDELLSKSLEEVFEDLKLRIGQPSRERFLAGENPAALVVFEHVAANRDLYRVMLKAQGVAGLLKNIHEYVAVNIEQRLRAVMPNDPSVPFVMLSHYCAGSIIALATWWLENDMPHSEQEMAQMYNRVVATGIIGLLSDKGSYPPSKK